MAAGKYSKRNVIAPEKRLLAHIADRIDDSMLAQLGLTHGAAVRLTR